MKSHVNAWSMELASWPGKPSKLAIYNKNTQHEGK